MEIAQILKNDADRYMGGVIFSYLYRPLFRDSLEIDLKR